MGNLTHLNEVRNIHKVLKKKKQRLKLFVANVIVCWIRGLWTDGSVVDSWFLSRGYKKKMADIALPVNDFTTKMT